MDENQKKVEIEESMIGSLTRGWKAGALQQLDSMVTKFSRVADRLAGAVKNNDDNQAAGLLPMPKPREVHIRQSVNGVYICEVGCNTWAFTDPTEMAFIILVYLNNPNMVERMINRARYGEGISDAPMEQRVAAVPSTLAGVGSSR